MPAKPRVLPFSVELHLLDPGGRDGIKIQAPARLGPTDVGGSHLRLGTAVTATSVASAVGGSLDRENLQAPVPFTDSAFSSPSRAHPLPTLRVHPSPAGAAEVDPSGERRRDLTPLAGKPHGCLLSTGGATTEGEAASSMTFRRYSNRSLTARIGRRTRNCTSTSSLSGRRPELTRPYARDGSFRCRWTQGDSNP